MALGKTHVVEGHVDVQLSLTNDKKFMFKNVLYIPGLIINLLSVSQIAVQGLHV